MFGELSSHEVLFSGPSFRLGEIHWYILKAGIEFDSKEVLGSVKVWQLPVTPEPTMEERIRAEILKMKKEGLLG